MRATFWMLSTPPHPKAAAAASRAPERIGESSGNPFGSAGRAEAIIDAAKHVGRAEDSSLAAQPVIADSAVITTKAASGASGTWLIDPTNFTIANGSAARRASGIGADTLAKALGNGNVTIVTATAGHQAGNMVEPSASGHELP
jgi:hypothetical protein